MPAAEEFREVADVVARALPTDADLSGIEFKTGEHAHVVNVWTKTPDRVIGRRGTTANAIRDALAGTLGDRSVQLNVREVRRSAE